MVRPTSHIGPSGLVRQSAPRPGDGIRIETCIVNPRLPIVRVRGVPRATVILNAGGFRFDRAGRELAPGRSYGRHVDNEYDVPRPEGTAR